MEISALTARFILATVFFLAGLAKLSARRAFVRGVERYEILPPRLLRPVAAAIPIFELAGGVLLVLGAATRVAAALVGLGLVGFTVAVVIALVQGKQLECGCFGPAAPRPITWWTVGRNLGLVVMAGLLVLEPPTALAVDAAFGATSRVSTGDAAAVLAAATTVVVATLLASEALRYRGLAAVGGPVP